MIFKSNIQVNGLISALWGSGLSCVVWVSWNEVLALRRMYKKRDLAAQAVVALV
ncbi:hypothetical protein BDV93DRAFT_529768 [Ceratobasidium sp. AG-I]|nr:hypothetical protein BDV93DRAFT_529768 [Ceratobasidium sp. AG-I]